MIKKLHSPSELMGYFVSPFEALMRRAIKLNPEIAITQDVEDPLLKLISQKGIEHESKIYKSLAKKYQTSIAIKNGDRDSMIEATKSAMNSGIELIYQGALSDNIFFGLPDFLIKEDGQSNFGDYRYKILDAKLAKHIKPEYLIQLSCYSELLDATQGTLNPQAQICLGDESYQVINILDFYVFYQKIKKLFITEMNSNNDQLPSPDNYRQWGAFSDYAETHFKNLDHLIQLPDIRESQIKKLQEVEIITVGALASTNLDHVKGMDNHIFKRFKNQARMHVKTQEAGSLQYELLSDCEIGLGLYSLPPKASLDVYFDIESNPFHQDMPLHYLWGAAYEDPDKEFKAWWAHSNLEMKEVFENFIDWVFQRRLQDTAMHVYHYGQFEITAIRTLMGLFGTREHEVDFLLRNNVFVDLLRVVKQSLCIGGSGYGLKKIEPLYMSNREEELASGGDSIVVYEAWASDPGKTSTHIDSALLKEIWEYNRVDCISLIDLVDWLRDIQKDTSYDFISIPELESVEEVPSFQQDIIDIQSNQDLMASKPHLKMLSNLCLFHKREDKPIWWRLFDRIERTDADLVDDLDCLGELISTGNTEQITARSKGFEYSFDSTQESKIKEGDSGLKAKQNTELNISIHELDPEEGLITLKSTASELPSLLSLIPCSVVRAKPISTRLEEIMYSYLNEDALKTSVQHLLKRQRPVFLNDHGNDLSKWADSTLDSLILAISELNNSYFCIQGPPGTGKTYSGARVINALVQQGKKIGVASNSHKAINNMLEAVIEDMNACNIDGMIGKVHNANDDLLYENKRIILKKNPKDMPLNDVVVVGGTSWTFSNDSFIDQLDYLFIDEAGQVPLANVVGMSASCKNIILIGDQMQLANPGQGTHPENSGDSCLDYLLQDSPTIPIDKGVLLPDTYRMHSQICNFISSRIYENRITSIDSNDNRVINHPSKSILQKSFGIEYIPVEHIGNEQASLEEALKIKEIIKSLLRSTKTNRDRLETEVTKEDILIVTPYNHQVRLLSDTLGSSFNIGTVDKFQGREAPIVIISMASSNALTSPRGLSFLFDPNRLNVAISRAQSLAILVASRELERPIATSQKEMKLSNLYLDLINHSST
ncbi:TM0106 family RecB-like putative nuclease [Gammaproteobacteria bacterium]|nr:TM0106 family RecB-like putative nuclease [Gammaproteobacteria bacterium]